jgi:hypothetical protein
MVTRSSIFFEAPKSASLTRPVLSTRMLAPLMSRWMMPLACRYSSPSRICLVYTRTTDSLNDPNLASSEAIDPPGTYSRKMLSAAGVRSVPR